MANKQNRTDAMLDALAGADPFCELRDYMHLGASQYASTELQDDVYSAILKADHGLPWAVGPIGNILVDPSMPYLSGVIASPDPVTVSTYLAATADGDAALGISLNDAHPFVLPVPQALEMLAEMMRWASTLTMCDANAAQIADLRVACHLLAQNCADAKSDAAVEARFIKHEEDTHRAMIDAASNRADPDRAL